MKIETIWTESEGANVIHALRRRYGNLTARVVIKLAAREVAELQRQEQQKTPTNTGMQANAQICQMIVEDQLNHLVREKLLTRTQCMSVRDHFVSIVACKLLHG